MRVTTIDGGFRGRLAGLGDSSSDFAAVQAQVAQYQQAQAQQQAQLDADMRATVSSPQFVIWSVLAAVSSAASAVHGYRRHRGSVGWAIGWGLCGAIAPIITPAIAVAEGFGKPMKRRK